MKEPTSEQRIIDDAWRAQQPPEVFPRILAETDRLFVTATVEQLLAYLSAS